MTKREKLFREALEAIVKTGTRQVTVRVGDMYAADGYDTYATVSEEAEIATAALDAVKL